VVRKSSKKGNCRSIVIISDGVMRRMAFRRRTDLIAVAMRTALLGEEWK
jgi:hypothetical protein